MTGGRRPLKGRKIADRRLRVDRPHAAYFRYTGQGSLVAKEAASRPLTPAGRIVARVKAVALGRPLSNEEEIGERLAKKKALAIFSSDAISSSAYATEEILRVLIVAAAAGALAYSIAVSVAIAVMLTVVSISYRQVCRAYPSGGGAYIVARENLAPMAGLIAAAALLIDYVMTVAVSTASAIQQIQSVVPQAYDYRIEIAFVSISLITIGNLRGLRESGNIFAVPTYLFVGLALLIVAVGLSRIVGGTAAPMLPQPGAVQPGTEALGLFLLLKAFAGGSVALTGVEAIANGVPAFKPPEAKNAANTMISMAVILGVIFIGLTIIAHAYAIVPSQDNSGGPTVVAIIAATALGLNSPLFILFQASTALILFLAANTSFNAFPRLAAILAADGYMPRQFSFRGDRLAYSWGIVLLAAVAFGLLVIFNGDTHALIPLYSVGVFVCFTLSQTGMVRHWRRVREAGWRWRALVNAFGGVLTAVVLAVVVAVKFRDGAYLVVILIPVLVSLMLFINRQYAASRRQLALRPDQVIGPPHRAERVVIPIPTLNRAVVQAVNVGRSISDDVRAVYISDAPDDAAAMRAEWDRRVPGVPLVVVESPYRALVGPLIAYLDVLDRGGASDHDAPITFIVVPEYVARNWWERILYNQSSKRLRKALLGRPNTVVVNVPYRREDAASFDHQPGEAPDTVEP
ncbi:MAG: APC family permease [Chloroflexi bacterium]|nr:APC family permease [Chloroflexota bacterium]